MPNFHPIRSERMYQKIVDQMKQMLNSGQLAPGDRLPSERDIAEQLGVSRAVVREAFSALELTGLIEVRPGEGTYVKCGDIVTPFALLVSVDPNAPEYRETAELRPALEGQAAALAAERGTEQDLAEIKRCLDRMEGDLTAQDLGESADWEFHLAVAAAAKNGLLLRVMYTLQEALRKAVATNRRYLFEIPGMPRQLLEEHRAIYAAICARNPEEARRLVVDHIVEAQRKAGL